MDAEIIWLRALGHILPCDKGVKVKLFDLSCAMLYSIIYMQYARLILAFIHRFLRLLWLIRHLKITIGSACRE